MQTAIAEEINSGKVQTALPFEPFVIRGEENGLAMVVMPAITEQLLEGCHRTVEYVYTKKFGWLITDEELLVLERDRTERCNTSLVVAGVPVHLVPDLSQWNSLPADAVTMTIQICWNEPLPLEDGGLTIPKVLAQEYKIAELGRFAKDDRWHKGLDRFVGAGMYRGAYEGSLSLGFDAWVMTVNPKILWNLWIGGIYPIILAPPKQYYHAPVSIFCWMPIQEVELLLKCRNPFGWELFTGKKNGGPTLEESNVTKVYEKKVWASIWRYLGIKGLVVYAKTRIILGAFRLNRWIQQQRKQFFPEIQTYTHKQIKLGQEM